MPKSGNSGSMRDFCNVIDLKHPVKVFRNLNFACYSVLQNGGLRFVAKQIRLENVEFFVRESGRQRMLRDQKRNVHAFAIGYILDHTHPSESRDLESLDGRVAYYNPIQHDSFVDQETQIPVFAASVVHLDERGLYYLAA